MFLKSIRAKGFKSFADKLDLEINPGITGIVGPNGSGKSNIVDAVKWVLGEQSVKQLRGEGNMTDVIFNGSSSRDAQKRAMVALTFDNSDHYLNSEFNELEIKRVVYNTGENEYYINNSVVRLKDITNLFLDVGVCSNAFNIISQGNVTDIVNSKASDRRIYFENAAGVLKYKKRKNESLHKLEKTEENLVRVKLVIDELEKTVKPLKKQNEEAKKYLNIKNNLEDIDIALMVSDITNLNSEFLVLKKEIDSLKEKVSLSSSSEYDTKIEKLKLAILNLEDNLNNKRQLYTDACSKLAHKNSEKQITMERSKYEVDKETINERLLSLKEEELNLKKEIDLVKHDISDLENNLKDEKEKRSVTDDKLLVLNIKKGTIENKYKEKNRELYNVENKIDILENNIKNAAFIPSSVRNVLNNPRLNGIHNTIGKLIDIPEKYLIAIDIALGGSSNFIVVDNETSASSAIQFLKDNRLGRATFFPLNVIKSKYIDNETLREIKKINGFLGVASELVSYEKIYENIIENQLGNIIVVNNNTTLNTIGKLINYRYRIVSLDGDILHTGGSITGGTSKQNSILSEKNELNKLKDSYSTLQIEIDEINKDLENYNREINLLDEMEKDYDKNIIILNEKISNKKLTLSKIVDDEKIKNSELEGMDNLLENKLDKKLVLVLEEINKLSKDKEVLDKDIKSLTDKKKDLQDELDLLEKKEKEENKLNNELNNTLKEKEVKIGKLEVNLDNLLLNLNNDYNLTYEAASLKYSLDMDKELAREKVANLKKQLMALGNVNLGAIDEFERVNKRYEFLNNQKDDLDKASQELKDIINDMDAIMVDKFKTTFNKINKEFSRIFKLMFKGGYGELKLCDPNDLLNTGIDIIAMPPGKKINSPLSLSGGEKSLTAIVLLFAMLQVSPAPFVILDEAESALDEANVEMFGKYLNAEKANSQFIVITHKKKMMEYADVLYGITMQESGVSKIVSAKLKDID